MTGVRPPLFREGVRVRGIRVWRCLPCSFADHSPLCVAPYGTGRVLGRLGSSVDVLRRAPLRARGWGGWGRGCGSWGDRLCLWLGATRRCATRRAFVFWLVYSCESGVSAPRLVILWSRWSELDPLRCVSVCAGQSVATSMCRHATVSLHGAHNGAVHHNSIQRPPVQAHGCEALYAPHATPRGSRRIARATRVTARPQDRSFITPE